MAHLVLPQYEDEFGLERWDRGLALPVVADKPAQSGKRYRTRKSPPRWVGSYQWGQLQPNSEILVEIRQFFFKLGIGDTVDLPVQGAPTDTFTSTTVQTVNADGTLVLAADIGNIPAGVLLCITGSGNRTYEIVKYTPTSRLLELLPEPVDTVKAGDTVNHATGIRTHIRELKTDGWPGGEGFEGPFAYAWEEALE